MPKVIRVRSFVPLSKQFPELAEAMKRGPAEERRWLEEHKFSFPKPGDPDWTPPLPLTEEGARIGCCIINGDISLEEGMAQAAQLPPV